jgi:uncharacterized SAM-binding protein YcdF (DUF218 family)
MGFFISKLLPLFIYPLGLSCLCLVVAMVCFWKRPRIAAITLVLSFSLQMLGGNYWLAWGLAQSLEYQNLPPEPMPTAAAIIVLGGATLPATPPRPWVEVGESGDRPIYAAKLYRDGKAPRVILSGGRVDWYGAGPPEAEDMAEQVQSMGVPATALLDTTSRNTYENAVNVYQILQTNKITGPLLLVTSAMHMPRAMAIFRKLNLDVIAAPTDFRTTFVPDRQGFGGWLISLWPDSDLLHLTTLAVKEYIGLLIYRLQGRL